MLVDHATLTLFDCRCRGLEVEGHCGACRVLTPWRPPEPPRGPEDEPIASLMRRGALTHRTCRRPLDRVEVRGRGNMMTGRPVLASYSRGATT